MQVESITPFLALAAALVGSALIALTRKSPNLRDGCSVGAAVLQFICVLTMLPPVLAGQTVHYTLLSFLPQVSIAFRVDALGLVFAATASFLWILTGIYAIGYMRLLKEQAQTRFFACFAITMAATMGIAFSANLVTLYIFYEVLTLLTYPLVTHKETEEAYAAGRKYIYYHFATSVAFLLPAIIVTYALSGTFSFQPHGVFPEGLNTTLLVVVYFLFLVGCAKAAIMPFHGWLPAAMVAPVPVSALLHAVAVVNAGVFLVLRVIMNVFGEELMLQLNLGIATAIIASFTILVASFYAYRLDSLKAVLAYSTISQLSYMVLGAALLNPSGLTGGVIHIANHAFSKITLFFCAGSIYLASHKANISEMGGIGRQLPWTMAAFLIGALSTVGVPATAGFITKWFLFVGAFEAKQFLIFFVLLIGTLLSAAYYLRVLRTAYFPPEEKAHLALAGTAAASNPHGEHHEETRPIHEVSLLIVVPLLVTAVLSIVFGLYPQPLLELARKAF